MTIEEVSEKYCIPIKLLNEYEDIKLSANAKEAMNSQQYDNQDIERLSMMLTLRDAGFSKEDIDEYMRLLVSGKNNKECMEILNQKRKHTLDEIHVLEKQLDNIDYLRNEIRNSEN